MTGVGILIYIFHVFFPIFIFNSYWFVVVVVVAMWIYLRESLASLNRQGGGKEHMI